MASDKILQIVLKAKDEASKTLDGFNKNIGKSTNGMASFTKVLGGAVVGVTAIATAVVGAGVGLFKMAENASKTGDRIDKMSQSLGMSYKGFQELDYVLGQNGMKIESMAIGMKTMTNAMVESQKSGTNFDKVFKQLGVSVTDTSGKMKSQEAVFRELVYSLQTMEDGTQKNILAQQLFGRSGQELIPLLNQQAGSVEQLIEEANTLGIVMSDTAVVAGVKFGDSMDAIKKSMSALGDTIGVEVMQVFQKMADWVIQNLPMLKENFNNFIKPVIDGFFSIVEGVYNFIKSIMESENVKVTIDLIKQSFLAFWDAVMKLWEAFKPYLPFLQALAKFLIEALLVSINIILGVLRVFINIVTELVKAFGDMVGFIKNMVITIFNTLKGAVELVGKGFSALGDLVKSIFNSVLGAIQPVINLVQGLADKISGVMGMLGGLANKASSAVGGAMGSVGSFAPGGSIAGRATGGNVYKNTPYMVGEKGPEMFMPNQSGTIIPNRNTGGGTSIVINVTGNQLLDDQSGEKIGDMIMEKLKYQLNIA
jgi:phage-related protein